MIQRDSFFRPVDLDDDGQPATELGTAAAAICGPCRRCWDTNRSSAPSATPQRMTTRSVRQRRVRGGNVDKSGDWRR
jgi:uncharacterized protein YcbX